MLQLQIETKIGQNAHFLLPFLFYQASFVVISMKAQKIKSQPAMLF